MPPKSNRIARIPDAPLAEWTPQQTAVIDSLSVIGWHGAQDPRALEVAMAAGVDVLTVAEWVGDPEFQQAVLGRMLGVAQLRFPPVLWRLMADAEEGKATAQKVLIEALGLGKKAAGALIQYNDLRGSQEATAESLKNKTDQEIVAEYRALADKLEQRVTEVGAGLGSVVVE
mgnify:CR=1 FL=1